jgi:hypothetical protein
MHYVYQPQNTPKYLLKKYLIIVFLLYDDAPAKVIGASTPRAYRGTADSAVARTIRLLLAMHGYEPFALSPSNNSIATTQHYAHPPFI